MVAQNAGRGVAAGGGGQWRRSVVVHTMCVRSIHTCCCSTQYLQCALFQGGPDWVLSDWTQWVFSKKPKLKKPMGFWVFCS